MKKWILCALVLITARITDALPTERLCDGFMPENKMWIPEDPVRITGIEQQNFDSVLDRLTKLYSAEIQSKGGTFKIERKWSDGTVNAYAFRQGRNWTIAMFGGMARHPAMTMDGFAMVACHEIGHHLGGAPKLGKIFNRWVSIEGEADYYATLKCMRRYFAEDDNEAIVAQMNIDPIATQRCAQEKSDRGEQLICIRSAMASISLGTVLAGLESSAAPKLDTPDTRVVTRMDTNHPPSQCRLDTYFNGALCATPVAQELNDRDYRAGACSNTAPLATGSRPRCWFKP